MEHLSAGRLDRRGHFSGLVAEAFFRGMVLFHSFSLFFFFFGTHTLCFSFSAMQDGEEGYIESIFANSDCRSSAWFSFLFFFNVLVFGGWGESEMLMFATHINLVQT